VILTQERLKEVLFYDPDTGLFVWIINKRGVKAGTIAGCVAAHGYIVIRIDGVLYYAHRLAIFYMTGEWPVEVDHKKHIRHDNRAEEIEKSTRKRNGRNLPMKKNNTTGCTGVVISHGKYQARIRFDGRHIHLGTFSEFSDACAVRRKAEERYFGKRTV